MKRVAILLFALFGISVNISSQTLNQSANWPNPNWVVSGTYNANPGAFEADPRTTSHFAFDDRDSTYGQRDNITAESPIIDLTDAHTAGETLLSLEVQYNYRHYSYMSQSLVIEYWVESMNYWMPWASVEGNIHRNNNYCYREKSTLLMQGLDIASFSATDLANFKYRISYTDPTNGSSGWGFCFDSPTIKSNLPIAPPNCAVHPFPADGATSVPDGPINLSWEANTTGTQTDFYKVYFALNSTSNLNYAGSFETPELYRIISLYLTDYYFKVVPVNLGGEATGCPTWHFISEDEPPVPSNDICSGATPITVQPQGANCSNPILMNNHSATNSSSTSGIASPSCVNQDANSGDLWYSFVAPSSGDIKIINKWTGDEWFTIGFVIYDDCSATNEVLCGFLNDNYSAIYDGFTPGQTYYLRIFDSGRIPPWDATKLFCIEEYTPPVLPPVNDECNAAIVLMEQFDMVDFIATNKYIATIDGASETGIPASVCVEGSTNIPNDDVWFKFTAETQDLFITIDDNYVTNCTVELFNGECGNLDQISCASGNENPTINATGLSIGTDYFVRVFSDLDVIPSEPVFGISVWTHASNPASINTQIKGLSLYPNPAKNILYINAQKRIERVKITNMLGQQVLDNIYTKQTVQLNISDLPNGTYTIRILSDNKIGIYYFIKS